MLFNFKNGFTLLELMITCAILAILLSMGLPYFHDSMARQEIKNSTQQIISSIQLAKSHAAIQHHNVVICASQNRTQCQADQWQSALIIFIDSNKNRQVDIGESIIATQSTHLKYGLLSWKGALRAPTLTFQSSNGLPIGSNGSFYYCSSSNQVHYKIVLSPMGNTRIEQPATC